MPQYTNKLIHSIHGEGPKRFVCEFCDKPFNRKDNHNQHRKLHARPESGNHVVVRFIPEAVSIIEQEARSRKPRAPPKSKLGKLRQLQLSDDSNRPCLDRVFAML